MSTNAEKQYDIETTLVSGIICKRCQTVLSTMTMAEHLDINNPLNICQTCELAKFNPDGIKINNHDMGFCNVCNRWEPICKFLEDDKIKQPCKGCYDGEYDEIDDDIDDKQFNCDCCEVYFNEGKDNCKKCGFDMNVWNDVAEHLDITNPLNICRTCELRENQQRRLASVEKWVSFLTTLKRTGKGRNTRYEWLGYIQYGARTVFDTEEKEYEYIGKFGRGIWSEEFLKKGFTKQEIEMIVEFANEFGAFDY